MVSSDSLETIISLKIIFLTLRLYTGYYKTQKRVVMNLLFY